MGKFLVESVNGVPPANPTGPVAPATPDPVKTQFVWDGDKTMAFSYTPCLVLVTGWPSAAEVEFQVIDADSGKIANATKFKLPIDDYDQLHPKAPSTLPPTGTKDVVSIAMICRERVKDPALKAVLDGAHLLGKWPRGEGDGLLKAIFIAVLTTKGVWKLLSPELIHRIGGLGLLLPHLPGSDG
jgi:hypothetical protein